MDSATAAASICLGNNKKISVCMYDDDLSWQGGHWHAIATGDNRPELLKVKLDLIEWVL